MLVKNHLVDQGTFLFRWRSYVLLAFTPFMVLAASQGEPIEAALGAFWGEAFEIVMISLIVGGLSLRVLTVGFVTAGTSGRNVQGQVASRLNTTGAYSTMRNPLYFANSMMYVGILMSAQSLALGALLLFALVIYYERIIAAEENFLAGKFGDEYLDWASQTPVFFPTFRNWQRPALGFCWRTALRREYPTVSGAMVLLFIIEAAQHTLGAEDAPLGLEEYSLLAVALVFAIAIDQIKKRTTWLKVKGR